MKNKYLLVWSISLSAVLILLTEPTFKFVNQGYFNSFEDLILGPLFSWSVAIALCAGALIFFNERIYKPWFRWILRVFVPIGLLVTFVSDTDGNFIQPGRTDIATGLGIALVGLTIVYIFVQRVFLQK